MDRLFRIDFYPQDWLIATARLTLEERGIYIQIVSLIYSNRGPIENDPKWIAGVSGCHTRSAAVLISKLIEKDYIQIISGKLSQKRAERELRAKREAFGSSSRGGRNNAENKRDLNKNNDLPSSDPANSLPSTSPTPSLTPSPEESKEDGGGYFSNFPKSELKQYRKQCPTLTEKEFQQELFKIDQWVKIHGAGKTPELTLSRWLQKAENAKPKKSARDHKQGAALMDVLTGRKPDETV